MPTRRPPLAVRPLEDRLTPAATVPPGFHAELFTYQLYDPSAMAITPDGRAIILEQHGFIRVVSADGVLNPERALTLELDDLYERGLIGIALDPEFASNGFVYLYYTVEVPDGQPAFNRISRFVMTGDTIDPASEVPLVDLDPLNDNPSHNGGAMAFGPDGKLYVATGDSTFPPNSQSLDTLHGKILRYNKDGTIPDDNPTTFDGVEGTTTGTNRAIWAIGFRNAFTIAFQPGTGVLYVNDVGSNDFEEVNAVTAGKNYGWPATEGDFDQAAFPGFTRPLITFGHGNGDDLGRAVIGGVFYPEAGGQFPAEYAGDYFYADLVNGWIRNFDHATGTTNLFASGQRFAIVDLDLAPDGSLWFLSRDSGRDTGGLTRIAFTDRPALSLLPLDQTVFRGRTVTFTSTGTGTGPLSYQWQRNGIDIPGATGPTLTLENVALADSGATYRVILTNPFGQDVSRDARLTVRDDRPPLVDILTPDTGGTFRYGQTISFSGVALDPEQGRLPASAYYWEVEYLTGDAPPRPQTNFTGIAGGSFEVPATSPYKPTNVKLRLKLTATDAAGNQVTAIRDLVPDTTTLSFTTTPVGVPLALDGSPAPVAVPTVVGLERQLSAPATQEVDGLMYRFVRWSDGETAATRMVSTPAQATTFAAQYAPVYTNADASTLSTALPPGFSESRVTAGLTRPTAQMELPDGRLLVAEQGGTLRVVTAAGDLVPAPALSLTVDARGERGLLGIALDPDFARTGFVYLYHTVPAAGGQAPFNRVSRGTLAGNLIAPDTLLTLVDLDPLSAATNHNGGALLFGADGKLYVATGENADPALAQSLTSRHGKILRYNRDGSIPDDNPRTFAGVAGTTAGANRAIWAVGFRNPFTFAVQPGTGRIFVNDVGQNRFEEINDLQRGANYGWPATEGDFAQAEFPDFTRPVRAYAHGGGFDRGFAIGGAAFYNPPAGTFPAQFYSGDFFYGDIVNGWIRRYDPATGEDSLFASTLTVPAVVDLDVSAGGDLLYLARGDGSAGAGAVYRIRFTQAPGVSVPPADVTVNIGGDATFRVTASGTAPLSYQWQRNGVDIPGATDPTFTLENAKPDDAGSRFRVVVRNAGGEATSAEATLFVGDNRLPRPTIQGPADGSTFVAGQTIEFRGLADDPEDGPLAPTAYTWRVDYVTGGLVRPFVPDTPGVTSGSFTIPTVTPYTLTDVVYRVVLTVRDSMGATQTVTRDIRPVTAAVGLRSSPAGVPLALDGQPVGDGFTGVAGVRRQLTAPATIERNGGVWRFAGWSDGVTTADRPFDTPTADATVTALYRPAAAVATAGAGGLVTLLDPLTNTVVGRFDLSARFGGGARVATGDVTGDGVPDILVGAAPGGAPVVAVYDGTTGAELGTVLAFESSFTGGVFVAAGDIDGDGRAELIVSPDEGGGPRVKVLGGADLGRLVADFFGIDDPNFRGGARVAAADLTGDGRADLIVSAGFGGGPRVAGYDGVSVAGNAPRKVFADFFAFETALRNGTFVSAGDLDGDGRAELVLGAGPGGGPRVLALSGFSLISSSTPVPLLDFFAGDTAGRGGVRVAVRDFDGDGRAELAAGSAPGVAGRVSVYRPTGELFATLTPFDETFTGGVFVG